MIIKRYFFLPLAAAIALTGCNKGMIVSFDDISSQHDNEGRWSQYLTGYPHQTKLISIGGTLPIADAGMACIFSGRRGAYSPICLTNDKSHIATHTYAPNPDVNNDTLQTIATSIYSLEKQAAKAISSRIKQHQCTQSNIGKQEANKTDCSSLTTSANSEFTALRNEKDKIYNAITQNNVFVYQWATENKNEVGGEAGNQLKAGASYNKATSGYALVAGLKISQLLVGCDFKSKYKYFNSPAKVATTVLQAKHIKYISSMDFAASLGLDLNMTPSEISNLLETLKEADKIAVKAALSATGSFLNQGNFSGVHRDTVDISDSNIHQLSKNNSDYQTFYVVMSDIEKIRTTHAPADSCTKPK